MDFMNYVELLIQYNGFLLIFSAIGFLFSLVWVILTERSQRKEDTVPPEEEKDIFDEKVFFGEFEKLENPALDPNGLKPIFENKPNIDLESDSSDTEGRKFIKMNDLPKFPTLKKEIEDTLENKTNDKKEVQGLLNEIKKDIKKNTK